MVIVGALLIPDAEIIIPNRSLSMQVPSSVYDAATGRISGLVGMAWPTSRFEPQSPYHMAESYYSIVYHLLGHRVAHCPELGIILDQLKDYPMDLRAVSSNPLSASSKITSASFANTGILSKST